MKCTFKPAMKLMGLFTSLSSQQTYHRKRQEKEKTEEKKELRLRTKPAVLRPKTVGIVQPLAIQMSPITPTSSKRNLTDRMQSAASEVKRRRLNSAESRGGGRSREQKSGRQGGRRPPRNSKVSPPIRSSPIKIIQLQSGDGNMGRDHSPRNVTPRKPTNPKADMECLLLAAGLEVCAYM